jgi:hypothetical protein
MQKPKIELYVRRSFGEKLSATFDFVQENWKIIFRFTVYLVLPISLLQAFGMNTMMSGIFGDFMKVAAGASEMSPDSVSGLIVGYSCVYGAALLAGIMGSSLLYGLMRLYRERQDRLQGVTMQELKPRLLHNIKRMCILMLVLVVFFVAVGLLGFVLGELLLPLLVFFVFFLIACSVPLTLLPPIYLMEDISILDAIRKTFRYGFKTWGGIFGLLFIVGLMFYLFVIVASIPWYITFVLQMVAHMDSSASMAFTDSVWFKFITYLLGIVQAFGCYLGYNLLYIALGIQYGHAAEKLDGVSVENDVEHFETLADNNSDDTQYFEEKSDIDKFDQL